MKKISSYAAVLLSLALPLATFGLARSRAAESHVFEPGAVPNVLGEFRVERSETLSDDVHEMLAPSAYLMRLYTRADSVPIWAYVAFYDGVGAKGAHDPEVCYPAQGWDVVGLSDQAFDLAGGDVLRTHFLTATLGASEELVLYWFQPPERWPGRARFEPWLRALDGLAGRSRYAFVRLSTRADMSQPESLAGAEAALGALARELALPVRSAVRGQSAESPG